MSKYTEEFKVFVIKKYLEEGMPIRKISRDTNINVSLVKLWVKKYTANGFINKKTKKTVFSSEFKLKVLNHQQEYSLSDRETAIKFGIAEHGTVGAWRRKYMTGGIAALKDARGRPKKMAKSLIPDKPREEWTKDEELAALRAENLYLKKLWTLIQQEEEQKKAKEKKNSQPSVN
ncbi:MAG: transposase [Treponema sp.]